ncbi:MAG: sugar ABC transporter ATP-binding protein [Verrucomicrobiales bacterium]
MVAPLLEIENVSKSFPGVRALDEVTLNLHEGECVALLGENGAGKSTLIKILAGAQTPDGGNLRMRGQNLRLASPGAASKAGIAVIHQELTLVPELTVRDNLFLGRDLSRFGVLRRKEETRLAKEWLEHIGLAVSPEVKCGRLTIAQQQQVEIARALGVQARILILDEPTASLTHEETERLLALLGELKRGGLGLVYISHRLEEIGRIADRIHILRDGKTVIDRPVGTLDRSQLIEHMVGRSLSQEFPNRAEQPNTGNVVLRLENLGRPPAVQRVSFEIRSGEILGMTGLIGAGRSELARLLAGADQPSTGSMILKGIPRRFRSPAQAIRAGIVLLPEDRKGQGLVISHGVRTNFALPNLRRFARWGVLSARQETAAFARHGERFGIRLARPDQVVGTLSGGNQQKVVLAKWLERNAEVLLFDEPTRGIDAGARYEIHRHIRSLANDGKAILLISSDLLEVLGMSDRLLVMREGKVVSEFARPGDTTQAEVLAAAMGE